MKFDGALTVDLEDWQCALNPREDMGLENRPVMDADSVRRNTNLLLESLERVGAKATFFVPGEVARCVPDLVREVSGKGHEIASHASVHLPLDWVPKQRFEEMLVDDLKFFEDVIGVRPKGFRAPYFSMKRDHGWLLETLAKHGILYDSSVVPTWTPYWGMPRAPKVPYLVDREDVSRANTQGTILEIPVSVWPTWGWLPGLPIGGGFYMRIWPYPLLRSMLKRIRKTGGRLVLYIHPGNLEHQKKMVSDPSMRDLLSQYFVAERGASSFNKIAGEFRFGTMESVFEAEINQFSGRSRL